LSGLKHQKEKRSMEYFAGLDVWGGQRCSPPRHRARSFRAGT